MRLHTTIIAKHFIQQYLQLGGLAIDATMGRGNDTKLLCELVGSEGKVLAFDIQQDAINSTKELLENSSPKSLLDRANLILDSHENMYKYAENQTVDCITFNFGYLPKGDHNISTKPETSIKAISQGLELLKVNGIMSLCVYQGGDTGFLEKEAILEYVKHIDCHKYTVFMGDFVNRVNYPPIFIGIVRDRL